jgi:PIN domain nuclease of toxin-antitoxin system
LWEIGSKQKSGRLELAVPLAALADLLVENLAVEFLPMMPSHSLRVTQLPDVHKDPFDRMLVCQAIGEDLVLLTPDPLVAQYPVRTHW